MRSSIASILLLLALVTSAQAECAWVLWGQYTRDDMQEVYFLSVAFESKSACNEAADKKNDISLRLPLTLGKGALSPVLWQCYPGTLDPRGPKGK